MATEGRRQNISLGDLMTVPQAAKAIGVHFATVYRWIEAGTILAETIGGISFVSKSEIEKVKNDRARSSVARTPC